MYEFESRVRYSESLHTGKMNPVSVSNYLQDCATFHSASIGKDINYYRKINRGWFLNSWQIDIRRYPECGEKIFIATWSYGFKGLYGYRNFTIRDEGRELCACANSIWFFTDICTGQPLRVPQEEGISYGQEEKLSMEYCPRKITLPEGMQPLSSYTTACHDIDTNGHMNNARYIELAWQCLPEKLQRSEHIWRIRAEYKKAALPGNKIYLQKAEIPLELDSPLEGFSGRCFQSSVDTGKQHIINLSAEDSSSKTVPSFASVIFCTRETI